MDNLLTLMCLCLVQVSCAALITTPASAVAKTQTCDALLKQAGLSDRFPGVIAHGIHSISVEDLQTFKADVNEGNKVPTVNMELDARPAVLVSAPLRHSNSSFKTIAMREVDKVLSHMNDPAYDVRQYSALERLVHALHMQEVWHAALPAYKRFASNPPNQQTCACATDIDRNGILKMLRFIALKVREPELMYGVHTRVNGGRVDWSGNLYNYAFFPLKQEDLSLPKPENVIPKLANEEAWGEWKKLMMGMKERDDYELAFYLYCALN